MEHLENISSDIQAAIEAGKCQVQKFDHDDSLCVVVPEGMKLEILEPFRKAPRDLVERVVVLTPAALLAYWEKLGIRITWWIEGMNSMGSEKVHFGLVG
ncbi:hypothetical protein [uncultured Zhongshania sp.]|uniref:hypothetical protein n=1 Tax=uncultured Zhongshania sp. TaxID=1642288 RepID=UPI0030DB5A94|tara:strand:+ start:878 stop:1174 length:297 start_codon:yes stop_codon:yes gene_type:complete